jgi:hypothetical protein
VELKYLLASLKQIKLDLEVIKTNSQMLDQRNAAVVAVQEAQKLAWSEVYDLMCNVENAIDDEKRAAQEAVS